MRTVVDEVERGEVRFLLFCTVALLGLGAAAFLAQEWGARLPAGLERHAYAAGFFALCGLITGGLALGKWLVYVRLHLDEEGLRLAPRYAYGAGRNFLWAEVSGWHEERYTDPQHDEEALASERLVVERPGGPPLLFPEPWRGVIREELRRRLPHKQRGAPAPAGRPAPGPFLPTGPETTTAIRP